MNFFQKNIYVSTVRASQYVTSMTSDISSSNIIPRPRGLENGEHSAALPPLKEYSLDSTTVVTVR